MDLVNLASNGHASPTEMSIGGIVMISVFVSLVFAVISGLSIYAVTRQAKRGPKFDEPVNWNAGQPTAPGEPTRCLLLQGPNMQPGLAIDVGKDEIRVTDLNTNALIASARLAQVTATPAENVIRARFRSRTPVLVVRVPGLQPLTIACGSTGPDAGRWAWTGTWIYRFSWRGDVPREKPPAYYVSLAEWLTLVEKFGLAPYLIDNDSVRG